MATSRPPNAVPVSSSAAPNRAVFVLALVGLLISGYLWHLHATEADAPCVFGSDDCVRVTSSRFAEFPVGSGISVAVYGTAGYLLLVALAVARTLSANVIRDRRLLTAIVLAAAGGVLFSLRLTYLALAVLHAKCPWCLTSQALILGIFFTALWDLLRHRRSVEPVGDAVPSSSMRPTTSA